MTYSRHGPGPSSGVASGSMTHPSSPPSSIKSPYSPLSLRLHITSPKESLRTCDSGNHLLDLRASAGSRASAAAFDEEEGRHLLNPYNLHLRPDPIRGNGVFSSFEIPAGVLLEESPALVMTKEEWEDGRINDTILGEYGFCWANGGIAIGLGIGMY